MAKAPLSGATGTIGFSGLVTCKARVPPCNMAFLSKPSVSKSSCEGLNLMDSFNNGVDSPDNIASLTIAEPSTNNKSHGMALSSWVLLMETKSPGNKSVVCNSTHASSL